MSINSINVMGTWEALVGMGIWQPRRPREHVKRGRGRRGTTDSKGEKRRSGKTTRDLEHCTRSFGGLEPPLAGGQWAVAGGTGRSRGRAGSEDDRSSRKRHSFIQSHRMEQLHVRTF